MPYTCPPEEILGQFLADRLSPSDEDDLELHLQTCDHCRDRLEKRATDADLPPIRVHPPLAADFAQRLEDSLRDSLNAGDDEWDTALPEIPGYDLLEIIGRGGSSVVCRARDQTLQRMVAIKVLRERAGRVDRERFNREVKALASLRHPNITRAHGAGEADQRLYLVMEFISGGSLGKYIAGRPQRPLAAARLVHQVAVAIQAAHDAGFVHRDLKPTNILLDAHFGQSATSGLDRFVPKVTDLGIVKDLTNHDHITQTRDCLGTPSYMAPEQVKGSGLVVDCRTDVYALGAVLYELLTGRPPFRAGSSLDTMLQVKYDEPVAPSRFQPKLPRDLETVCLKCLEKDPSRRYQSSQLVADDLRRMLDGQPILARRTRWPGRLWRWCRRNPGWATCGIIAAGIVLASAVGGPILAEREHHLRRQAIEQERRAEAEHARARDQYELASEALQGTLEQVLRNARLQDTALDDVRAGVIRGAIPYYEQFLQRDNSDPSVRVRQAGVLLQLASVHAKEGQPDKARAAYLRSLDLLGSLGDQRDNSFDRRRKSVLASAHLEYGRFLQLTDDHRVTAEKQYRQALALQDDLLAQIPNDAGRRDNTAIALSLLGTLLMPLPGRASEAEGYLSRAVELRDLLIAEFPQRDDLRHYAALAHYNLGMLYRRTNNDREIREFQIAWEQERLVNEAPSVRLESAFYLSSTEGELGVALARANRRDDAARYLKAALGIAEALSLTYPGVTKYTDLQRQWRETLNFLLEHK